MEQLGLAGMPQRLYRCTPTRLAAWLDCPRRYRMTYLDRPAPRKGPPWAHNSLGASVHNALAGWWRLPLAGRSVTAAGDLLERGWIEEGFADQAQSTAARSRARRMVERYVAGLDPGREPVGVERTVATRTDRIAVSGRIDRLDERPEDGGTALVVVDYKTGRRPLSTGDAGASMPLALYALAGAAGAAAALPPGGTAPPADRGGTRLGALGRHAGQAPRPRRGYRRRVRGCRRAVRGHTGPDGHGLLRCAGRGLSAKYRPRLRLVRFPWELARGPRGSGGPPPLGRARLSRRRVGRGERAAALGRSVPPALGRVPELGQRTRRGLRCLYGWRMRGTGNADAFGVQPQRHVFLDPGIR